MKENLSCYTCGNNIEDPSVLDHHEFTYLFPENAWELGITIDKIEEQLEKQAQELEDEEEAEEVRKHGPLTVPVCSDCQNKSKKEINCFVCGTEMEFGPTEEPDLSFLLPEDAEELDVDEERIRWEAQSLEKLRESPHFEAPEPIEERADDQGLLIVPVCDECRRKAVADKGFDYVNIKI